MHVQVNQPFLVGYTDTQCKIISFPWKKPHMGKLWFANMFCVTLLAE